MKNVDKRWIATMTYNSLNNGPIDVEHHVEEISEIEDLVENGPDWNSLIDIKIILNPKMKSDYSTIEEASRR